jgi:SOS-response transcriptional repressor LexA
MAFAAKQHAMTAKRVIPVAPAAATGDECGGAEPFALMVLGDSMEPEFRAGEIIVIEPEGLTSDGSYVLAQVAGDWTFRQLARVGAGWELRALNPAYPASAIPDLSCVKGVIIQKSLPGRRRASKRYVD